MKEAGDSFRFDDDSVKVEVGRTVDGTGNVEPTEAVQVKKPLDLKQRPTSAAATRMGSSLDQRPSNVATPRMRVDATGQDGGQSTPSYRAKTPRSVGAVDKFKQAASSIRKGSRKPFNTVTFILLLLALLLASGLRGRRRSTAQSVVVGDKDFVHLRKGTSLVSACDDWDGQFMTAVRTWKAAESIDEIVLVDWGSEVPLSKQLKKLTDMERISIVQVDEAGDFSVARATNLGVHFANFDTILRVDCDYALKPEFLRNHRMAVEGEFFAGNWSTAANANELRLNGALLVRQSDFWKVNGYDERLESKGWEDEDLYQRLVLDLGLRRRNVDFNQIAHLPHLSDSSSSLLGVIDIDCNALMLERTTSWSKIGVQKNRSGYRTLSDKSDFRILSPVWKPRGLHQILPLRVRDGIRENAISQRLHYDYNIPAAILDNMHTRSEELLLTRLLQRDLASDGSIKPTVLFAHCMHGLGNRIRALGSSLAVAKNTGREVVIIWDNDRHLGASFNDLFKDEYPVIENMKIEFPFQKEAQQDSKWYKVKAYDYMDTEPGAEKNQEVKADPGMHVYYKGAYIMNAPGLSSWKMDNDELQKLTPSDDVQAIIDRMKDVDFSHVVSVHIRDRGLSTDIRGVDFEREYTDKAAEGMQYWREKSHYTNFIPKMRMILAEDPETRFYLSSDTVSVLDELHKQFGARILLTERHCDDRTWPCAKYALADLYLLAKGQYVLGSNWSSFTEAAQRLGSLKGLLSGRDFATEGVDPNFGVDKSVLPPKGR